ncbi:TPA: hypothetical protein ACWZ8K_004703 [Escherichia coli]
MSNEKRTRGRPRQYDSAAARQRAYRERLKSQGKRTISRVVRDTRDTTKPLVSDIIDLSPVADARRMEKTDRLCSYTGTSQTNEVRELRKQLDAARNEILRLRAQLACFITENDINSGKKWSIQERKGTARWQTVEKGLSRQAAEARLDKLAASVGTSRYSYRMTEE